MILNGFSSLLTLLVSNYVSTFPTTSPFRAFRSSEALSRRLTTVHIMYQQNNPVEDDSIRFGEKYNELGRNRISPSKKEYTFIGPSDDKAHTMPSLIQYFVPGFVLIWAAGYSAIFLGEMQGDGLGDIGGFLGVGFTVFLLLALFGAAAYETFKPMRPQ